MNVKELEVKLLTEGFDQKSYEFYLEYPNEAYTIHEGKIKWEVYYGERGCKSGLKKFKTEDEACKYFYQLINANII